MTEEALENQKQNEVSLRPSEPLVPTREQLSLLSLTERIGFRLTHRMNLGAWKRLMGFFQRHIGSSWIQIATYNLINIYGLENIEKIDSEKPVLLVANHRSYFDMYVVSAALFRRTKLPMTLFFPVRAKFFYTSPMGWFVNLVMGWFSMYPPFFREEKEALKREFDKYSLKRLIQICTEGRGHMIGFHPEGKRNLNDNPYEFLPAQPGVGAVIIKAQPQVIPVFVAGLNNDLPKQILGNWRSGEKIRVRFGKKIDLSPFYEKGDRLRTHKEIADFLMTKIGELAEEDRKEFGDR